jgi:hypothetical protein
VCGMLDERLDSPVGWLLAYQISSYALKLYGPLSERGALFPCNSCIALPRSSPIYLCVTSLISDRMLLPFTDPGLFVFYLRSYAYCGGSDPSPDSPCEPGALAIDPDGGLGGQSTNLTASIVACPPTVCLGKNGCGAEVRKCGLVCLYRSRTCSPPTGLIRVPVTANFRFSTATDSDAAGWRGVG